MHKQLLTLPLFLMLPACAHLFAVPTEVGLDDDGQLYYRGSLDRKANRALFALYKQAAEKPRILRITSGGGNVHLGMDIGEWVFRNKLEVHVEKACASSCANYIFTAGKRKHLDPDSILYWHGGARQAGLTEHVDRETLASVERWREREKRFFERIGVDSRITVCGQPLQLQLNESRSSPYLGFDYSIDDMQRFGVKDVVLSGDNWNWRNAAAREPVLRVAVVGRGHRLRCVEARPGVSAAVD